MMGSFHLLQWFFLISPHSDGHCPSEQEWRKYRPRKQKDHQGSSFSHWRPSLRVCPQSLSSCRMPTWNRDSLGVRQRALTSRRRGCRGTLGFGIREARNPKKKIPRGRFGRKGQIGLSSVLIWAPLLRKVSFSLVGGMIVTHYALPVFHSYNLHSIPVTASRIISKTCCFVSFTVLASLSLPLRFRACLCPHSPHLVFFLPWWPCMLRHLPFCCSCSVCD